MKIVENRKRYFIFSLVIILVGLIFMVYHKSNGNGALNYDVEFTGGTALHVDIGKEYDQQEIIRIVSEHSSGFSPQIQSVLGSYEVIIKTRTLSAEERTAIVAALQEKYEISGDVLLKYSDISATISGEMQKTAVKAVLVACAAMLLYVSIRFRDFKAGASSIIALSHDLLVLLAAYAVFRIPVNNSFIAALLTILGYSINATIVIFDRVRENKGKIKKTTLEETYNKSIMQTLARSLNTACTSFIAIACVYVFGVQSIREFALPIAVGIICGTYSSVFLAGSVWYSFIKFGDK